MKQIIWLTFATWILAVRAFSGSDQGSGFYVAPAAGVEVENLGTPPVEIVKTPETGQESRLPTLPVRDTVFAESGLTKPISQLDSFDRDSVYLRLTSKGDQEIRKIVTKFPQFGEYETNLKKAQELIALRSAGY